MIPLSRILPSLAYSIHFLDHSSDLKTRRRLLLKWLFSLNMRKCGTNARSNLQRDYSNFLPHASGIITTHTANEWRHCCKILDFFSSVQLQSLFILNYSQACHREIAMLCLYNWVLHFLWFVCLKTFLTTTTNIWDYDFSDNGLRELASY